MKRYDTTPKKDGFHMPAEFGMHAGSWMLWPERPDNWRNGGKPAQRAYVEIAKAIRRHEPLTVGVNEAQYENAVHMLPDEVRVVQLSSDDAWIRDCGPTFVINDDTSEVRGVDCKFRGWGVPTDRACKLDDQIARKICDMEYKNRYRLDQPILEGGAIETDGEGTIITTEECLLPADREVDLSKEELSENLCMYLGCEKVIWLEQGMYLDETHGHVENMCRFVAPGKVVLAWTDDTKDPQHDICVRNLAILESERDAHGRELEIIKLMLPTPLHMTGKEVRGVDVTAARPARIKGQRLCASYAGFYIVNGGVIVPQFGDPMDEQAVSTLSECFPDRDIEPVAAREILLGGGNIHSITLQQPVAPVQERPRRRVVRNSRILTASPKTALQQAETAADAQEAGE